MLPAQLVRSTGLLTHMGTLRDEWALVARAAYLHRRTAESDADGYRYRNRRTGAEHTVPHEEGTIVKSKQGFVEDVRRRIWKKAVVPTDRATRADWTPGFERDYDRLRRAAGRVSDYVTPLGPAVASDNKRIRDGNGLRWSIHEELQSAPVAPEQRSSVRCTGPEPDIDLSGLHIDVFDAMERLVAHREKLHEAFTQGWTCMRVRGADGDLRWTPHKPKHARKSHQWSARNGHDDARFVSVGRWRRAEIERDDLQRACTVPWIVADIDGDDWQHSAELAQRLLARLAEHGADLSQVVVSHTGGRSLHVRIPSGFFGNRVYKSADAAATEIASFFDRLCEDDELREAIDDAVFHPRQMVRKIGSLYEPDRSTPDNGPARAELVSRLSLRPQIRDHAHAVDVADQILDFLSERSLDLQDVTLNDPCDSGTASLRLRIDGDPDRTPNTRRVVALTADEALDVGLHALRELSSAWSDPERYPEFDLPGPAEAPYIPSLDRLHTPPRRRADDTPASTRHTPPQRQESDTPFVGKQPSRGEANVELKRALQVRVEGERWGRDVDRPDLVGRNRAFLTIALYAHSRKRDPWRFLRERNALLRDPLPLSELRRVSRSAQAYVERRCERENDRSAGKLDQETERQSPPPLADPNADLPY
jgi:hypothetical protein